MCRWTSCQLICGNLCLLSVSEGKAASKWQFNPQSLVAVLSQALELSLRLGAGPWLPRCDWCPWGHSGSDQPSLAWYAERDYLFSIHCLCGKVRQFIVPACTFISWWKSSGLLNPHNRMQIKKQNKTKHLVPLKEGFGECVSHGTPISIVEHNTDISWYSRAPFPHTQVPESLA